MVVAMAAILKTENQIRKTMQKSHKGYCTKLCVSIRARVYCNLYVKEKCLCFLFISVAVMHALCAIPKSHFQSEDSFPSVGSLFVMSNINLLGGKKAQTTKF